MDLVVLIGAGLAILFCIIATYTDISTGKIPNQLILIGMIFSLAFLGIGYHHDLLFLITNGILSILLAYIFWHVGWWRGGDAKLAMILGMLAPTFTTLTLLPFFPALLLFAIAFIIPSIGLLLLTITRTSFDDKKKSVSRVLSFVARYAVFLFGASYLLYFIIQKFFPTVSIYASMLLLVLYTIVSPLKLPWWILGLFAGIRAIVDQTYYLPIFWLFFILLLITFMAIRVLQDLSILAFVNFVHVHELEPRTMIAVQQSPQQIRELYTGTSHILTAEDILKITELSHTHKFQKIPIVQHMAFAPFFLISVLLTLLLRIW